MLTIKDIVRVILLCTGRLWIDCYYDSIYL